MYNENNAESIARHLGAATKAGDNWSCRCPAHEDKRASLSIKDAPDGKLLVHCHAGCHQDDVINALKLHGLWPGARITPPRALPPPVQINLGQGRGQIVQTYDYVNEDGELLYQAVRYEPKDFRQRRPDGEGWSWSIKGVRRVLYRLPDVMAAVAEGQTIYICEGEKDVETARSLGLVATCNAMGADNGSGNKWLPEFADVLVNADVVVVPDQDDAGTRHAEWVIQTLTGKARSISVVVPKSGKDLTDWVNAGATREDIEAAAIDAFELEAPTPKFPFLDVADLVSDIRPINWLVRDYLERDSIALVYGAPGGGKSFMTVDLAASVAMGSAWMGHQVHAGRVFYIAGEGHNGLARRFRAWEVAKEMSLKPGQLFKSAGAMQVLDEAMVLDVSDQIAATCSDAPPAMVVIDTLARNFGAGDENSTEDMSRFITHVDRHLRQRFGCCVLLVHHSGHNMERARGSSALKAAVDAEYEITKDDAGGIKIRTTKMKDAELPPELLLRIKGVELPGLLDEDGQPVTSAVLEIADDMINSKVAERTDGTKILAKDALAVLDRGWLSIRNLGEALGCSKRQAENVVASLRRYGLVTDKALTQEGKEALSRTGHNLVGNDKPIWKRGDEEVYNK
jgi:5S rRNA maturation endonuclease (ribonuclease M5)